MQKYNWNYPTTMWVGENRIKDLGSACKSLNIKKPLLVTDKGLSQSDIVKNTLSNLKNEGIAVELYSNVVGNPTGTNVNEGVESYKKNNCDGNCLWWREWIRCWKGSSIYVWSNFTHMGF